MACSTQIIHGVKRFTCPVQMAKLASIGAMCELVSLRHTMYDDIRMDDDIPNSGFPLNPSLVGSAGRKMSNRTAPSCLPVARVE